MDADHPFLVWSSQDGLGWQLLNDPACSEPWVSASDGWPAGTEVQRGGPVLSPLRVKDAGSAPRLVASIASVADISDGSGMGAHSFGGSSADGRCWTWTSKTPSDGMITRMLAVGDRLVAFGSQRWYQLGGGDIAAWTTSDGLHWDAAKLPMTHSWRLSPALVLVDVGPVAVVDGPVVLHSVDGTSWTNASVPDAARDGWLDCQNCSDWAPRLRTAVSGAAYGTSGLVAVGSTTLKVGEGPTKAVVWIAPAAPQVTVR